jgi:succinylglutamic semialdehyde dehydrogenase
VLLRYKALAAARQGEVAEVLCAEVGKALWECRAEAGLLATKVDVTLDAGPQGGRARVTPFSMALSPTREGRCLFRPHGAMAVVGPFNFPAHLPNGHIVPALLAGNTVVFKPSDKAPAVGQLMASLFHAALTAELGDGGAAGVVNLVHGGADVASALVADGGIDAIAFTGSWPVGRRILEANLDRPGRIVALELGGNNPAVVMADADLRQAAVEVVRCAFNTTGQRCTCTRRVVVAEAVAERFVRAVVLAARGLRIGPPRSEPAVFTGPIISDAARGAVFQFQERAAQSGTGEVLLAAERLEIDGGYYLTPSVVRVGRFVRTAAAFSAAADGEVFGPLLRVSTARGFEDALEQANATDFGLAASVFTADAGVAERFVREARAGCVNVNTGTAGASGKLPFGGLGHSGNHRPAGSFALDYCAYPVAAMVERSAAATVADGMTFDDAWLAG